MQDVSESEIQREVQALRSHRRISVNRPLLDPDLPELASSRGGGRELLSPDDTVSSSSASSASSSHLGSGTPPKSSWTGVSLNDDGPLLRSDANGPALGSLRAARSTFSARRRGTAEVRDENETLQGQPADSSTSRPSSSQALDSSHLFWVPASMHPEISPSDFRKFLHEHASRAVRDGNERQQAAEAATTPTSPPSPTFPITQSVDVLRNRSTSIARRGSTLRRQYRPESDSDADSGLLSSARRSRPMSQNSSTRGSAGPELSIDDLQKLEKLAEEASKSSDPNELRSVLRRTMSLSMSPSALDQVDALPQENEQDAPLIPRPGQILRRAARTKIRKSSISGMDSPNASPGGSRLGARRRGTAPLSGFTAPSSEKLYFDDLEPDARDEESAMTLSDSDDRRQSGASSEGQIDNSALMHSGEQYAEHSRSTPRKGSDTANDSALDAVSRSSAVSDETHRSSMTSIGETASKHASLKEQDAALPNDTLPQMQSLTRITSPPAHSTDVITSALPKPKQDVSKNQITGDAKDGQINDDFVGHREIRPIVVQNLPPLPSFEKTRPAPRPPATPSSSSLPSMDASSLAAPDVVPSKSAVSAASSITPRPDTLPHSNQRLTKSDTMPNLGAGDSVESLSGTSPGRTAKEKKSGFGLHWLSSWTKDDDGDSKLSKKEKKERKERERQTQQLQLQQHSTGERGSEEKDKDSQSFLGSLFGKRKGHDDASKGEVGSHVFQSGLPGAHVTAGSLLDMRNRGLTGYYQRYPIHIERAVYRLSHIKLANPRRPLYEQVLISNLMFWYLSVINKPQQSGTTSQQKHQEQHQQQQQQHQPSQQQQEQSPHQQERDLSSGEKQIVQETDIAKRLDGVETHESNGNEQAGRRTAELRGNEELRPMPMAVPAEVPKPGSSADEDTPPRTAPVLKTDAAVPHHDQDVASAENGSVANTLTSSLGKGAIGASGKDKSSGPTASGRFSAKPKRTGLVKPGRAPPGSRSAERAIPGATYGAQHQRLNSEMAASQSSANSSGGASLGDGYIKSLGLNVINDKRTSVNAHGPTGGEARPPRTAPSHDEYAWLGSHQHTRRPPTSEEQRSDTLPEFRKGQRTNSFAEDEEMAKDAAMQPAYTFGEQGENNEFAHTSLSLRNRNDDLLSHPRSNNGNIYAASTLDKEPASIDGERVVLPKSGSYRDATSAMLDAARLSQSRRR